jgi:glycosyltransferase involved in cell wall biosynthesis
MNKIKSILVANNHLNFPGGSETYTYTLIAELVKKGYDVEYFTFEKGDFSNTMEKKLGVVFMTKNKYDLILANHNTCVKHLKKKGFTIQTCHGIFPELEQPSIFADFHVAISQEVGEHLAIQGFYSTIIMNGIDVNRFYLKKSLNSKLTNVLSLCQSQEANDFLKLVCDKMNLNFTFLNKFKNPIWEVEELINNSDLVIGLGRSAYEAMACGRPVIIYDNRPYSETFADGYVIDKLANSLINNCSGRFYKLKFTEEQMIDEFKKYKAEDGLILNKFINDNLTIAKVVDKYIYLAESLIQNKKNIKKVILSQFLRMYFGNSITRKYFKYFDNEFYRKNV